MEFRPLGGSGFMVPVLSFGTGTFGGRGEFFKAWGGSGVEEALRALDDLVRAGKVRYIGCSNFSGWHLMKALSVSDRYGLARYVAYQAYYSVIGRDYEWELMPQIAINWLLQRPTVANVIIGARNEEQLRQNLGSVGWKLSADQVARLDAASATTLPYPYWHQRLEFPDRNPPPVK